MGSGIRLADSSALTSGYTAVGVALGYCGQMACSPTVAIHQRVNAESLLRASISLSPV